MQDQRENEAPTDGHDRRRPGIGAVRLSLATLQVPARYEGRWGCASIVPPGILSVTGPISRRALASRAFPLLAVSALRRLGSQVATSAARQGLDARSGSSQETGGTRGALRNGKAERSVGVRRQPTPPAIEKQTTSTRAMPITRRLGGIYGKCPTPVSARSKFAGTTVRRTA